MLLQFQPFYRPKPGGAFVAWYHTGAPQPFPWQIDVLGDGTYGAHGGSGLSAMGGSIRRGELLPATGAITHALKVELWAHRLVSKLIHGVAASSFLVGSAAAARAGCALL